MKKGALKFPLKGKYVAMLAPSFVVDFSYPEIIFGLKQLGFDKVVELTFGAKMVNREYSKKLSSSKNLVISSTCPGVVENIRAKFPQYGKNLIFVDSPMVAMAKICKKTYPKHEVIFISPCNFKKVEANKSKYVDGVIDYGELKKLFELHQIDLKKFSKSSGTGFDKFYNDYTKIYPLSGGLTKTLHLKGILKKDEVKIVDGIGGVFKFLKKPEKGVKFLDVTFCKGGCIGGPCVNSSAPLFMRKKRVLKYMNKAKQEDIPECKKGLIKQAKGIKFSK